MTIKLFQNLKKQKLRNKRQTKYKGIYIFQKTDRKNKEIIKQTNKDKNWNENENETAFKSENLITK
jgi:hypothetical protein